MACCIGGIIAGPNPVYRADVYAALDGVDFADSDEEQDPGDFLDNAVAAEAGSFTVDTKSVLDDIPNFPLIGSAPGSNSFDQAFFPPADPTSFQASFDNIVSAPLEQDFTAFIEEGDFSGFRPASVADQSNSIFGDVSSWISGDTDLFLKDFFDT